MTKHRTFASLLGLGFIILICPAVSAPAARDESAPPKPLDLTIPNIMRGEELAGSQPSSVRWSADGRKLYFRWKKPGDAGEEL